MYNTNLGTMVGYYNIQGAQEIEQQGLQTLYLMNPGYPGYEDTPATSPNILLLNSAASSVPPSLNPLLTNSSAAPATSNSIHQLLGIPLLPAASTSDPNHYISSLQAFNSNLNPRLWSSSAMPPHQLGLRQQQQGLSLSLSPHRHRVPIASASETGLSNGVSDMQRFWMGSKYLKVAQQLLDEVVSAGNESKGESTKGSETKCRLRSAKAAELGKNEKASDFTTAERQDLHMKNVKLVNMLEEVEQRYKLYHRHIQTIVFSFEAAMGSGAARTYTALALQTISKHFRWLKDVISAEIRGNAKSLGEEGSLGEEDKSSSGSRLRLIDQQLRQKRAFQQIGMVQHNAWRPQRGLPERSVSILRAWLFEHFLHPYPKDSDKQLLAKQTGLTRSQVSNWFINARVRLWKPMVEEMYMEELKGPAGDIPNIIGDENSSSKSNNANNNIGEYSTSKSSNVLFDHDQEIFVSPTKIEQTPALTPPPQDSAILPTSWDQEEECRQSNPAKRVRSRESNTMQQHSMNMDFGVMEDRDLMIKFGMGLQKDEEDRSHGYSLMSRKISSGDIAAGFSVANYPAGQLVESSCRCLISVEPTTPRLMMNKSVALTLGLPPHADNNNNNNFRLSSHAGGEHGQSFLSSTAHERIQQQLVRRSRVELSSRGSSNSEYLGGGLNKDPSSYSSNSLYI